jgi:ribosomal protein L7/L12
MAIVEITGWRPGFLKVSCTTTLRAVAGLGLAEAKAVTDGVLRDEPQRVQVPDAKAHQLVLALRELGASADVVEGNGDSTST